MKPNCGKGEALYPYCIRLFVYVENVGLQIDQAFFIITRLLAN